MRQVTAEIGKYALSKGKSIVKEELSFIKKKSQTEKGSGRRYNKMLHTLDYSRYEDDIRNMAVRNGIDLIEVNPSQSGIYQPDCKNEVLPDKKDPCPQRSGVCHSPKRTGV